MRFSDCAFSMEISALRHAGQYRYVIVEGIHALTIGSTAGALEMASSTPSTQVRRHRIVASEHTSVGAIMCEQHGLPPGRYFYVALCCTPQEQRKGRLHCLAYPLGNEQSKRALLLQLGQHLASVTDAEASL